MILNKKAFTLVELIAVIAILLLVLLIAIQSITSSLSRSDNKQLEGKKNLIVSSVEKSVKKHANYYNSLMNGECSFPVNNIKNNGWITDEMSVDSNGNSINGCVVYDGSLKKYKFVDDVSFCPEMCSDQSESGSGAGDTLTKMYLIDYIKDLYNTGTPTEHTDKGGETYEYRQDVSMMKDVGENIRYYGPNPDNYVIFNGERWRIIGLFNNMDDGSGNKHQMVKIIKAEPIGALRWNYCGLDGVDLCNDWTNAWLKDYLNNDYLNSLSNSNLISNVVWNIGSNHFKNSNMLSIYAAEYYRAERSSTPASASDKTLWPGKIALMYPSDYMYAGDLTVCNNGGAFWHDDVENCVNKTWLSIKNYEWTLMSTASGYAPDGSFNSNPWDAYYIRYNGGIDYSNSYYGTSRNYNVRPALYLKPNVKIISGSGELGDEFIIGI